MANMTQLEIHAVDVTLPKFVAHLELTLVKIHMATMVHSQDTHGECGTLIKYGKCGTPMTYTW